MTDQPLAYCFDLDGTLYVDGAPIPGAPEAVARLRKRGLPMRFLSNTTSRSRSAIIGRLGAAGIAVQPDEIFTATVAGARVLAERGCRSVGALVPDSALEDLHGFQLVPLIAGASARGGKAPHHGSGPEVPDAVVIGDMGDGWTDALLQRAFGWLMEGADFIALSRDRYWLKGRVLTMDCGGYVAALEHATGRTAALAGKPSRAFFGAALASLPGIPADRVVMVGDDLESDIAGAMAAGMRGWLVRTGKGGDPERAAPGDGPQRVLESVAELIR